MTLKSALLTSDQNNKGISSGALLRQLRSFSGLYWVILVFVALAFMGLAYCLSAFRHYNEDKLSIDFKLLRWFKLTWIFVYASLGYFCQLLTLRKWLIFLLAFGANALTILWLALCLNPAFENPFYNGLVIAVYVLSVPCWLPCLLIKKSLSSLSK